MRIVFVTPLPAELDSRNHRHAASLARLGHELTLVEGRQSLTRPDSLPFDLISAGPPRRRVESGGAELRQIESPRVGELRPAPTPASRVLPWPLRLLPLRVRRLPRDAWGLAFRLRERATVLLGRLKGNMRLRENIRLLRLIPAADVYVLSSFEYIPAVWAAASLRGSAVVYDAHDSYFEVYRGVPRKEWPPHARIFERLERALVRRASGFLTSSEGVAELLGQRHARAPTVIPNYHDSRLDRGAPTDLRRQLGLDPQEFLCVVLGNSKRGTTGEQALEALQALPDTYHLAFVGHQHGAYAKLIAELGLERRAHLVEPVPSTQLVSYVSGSDVSAILHRALDDNYRQLTPCRLYHSVAAGLPLLYAPWPGIESVAGRYRLGLSVDPTDPAQIAAALATLSDPAVNRYYRGNVAAARERLEWTQSETVLARAVTGLDGATGRRA